MNLILAQGAEHTKPHKLREITGTINKQRNILIPIDKYEDVCNMITDKFVNGYSDWYWADTKSVINMHDYSVEEKYDGYSYLNTKGRFFSKRLSQAKGNEGNPVEKTGHMPHIARVLKLVYETCGCDLHGELYVPGGISDDVTRILGCNEDEAITRQVNGDKLHYRLIDIRAYDGKVLINESHRIRHAILEYVYYSLIKPLDKFGYIQLAETLYGDPRDEFKRIVNSGGEGIIIKREDALYLPGKKPANNWIKGKKKITHDVVIMGFNDGSGKNKSLFGSIEFGHYIDGKLVKCGNASSGLDDATRNVIANDPSSFIGTVMEIEAIQESMKSYRNAVFRRLRDDKSPEECIASDVAIIDTLF